jgi:hypothetical protein
MKQVLVVIAALGIVVAATASAGERVVCKVWLDDGGIVARSTAPSPLETPAALGSYGLSIATLDGLACPVGRLQTDGGILSSDGGFTLTNAAGTLNSDGGYAGCPACDFRGVSSIVMQCRDPVYYSEKWDGGSDTWNQRGVVPATTNDILVDFDANPDGYRIDLRGSAVAGQNQHISVKPVSASASNFCTFSTIKRSSP